MPRKVKQKLLKNTIPEVIEYIEQAIDDEQGEAIAYCPGIGRWDEVEIEPKGD